MSDLGLNLPEMYAKDPELLDALAAQHPTWGRDYLEGQLVGARGTARHLAENLAYGIDRRGGWHPPPGVTGVIGLAPNPAAPGPASAYRVAVDLHAGGVSRRVEIPAFHTVADAAWILRQAADSLLAEARKARPPEPAPEAMKPRPRPRRPRREPREEEWRPMPGWPAYQVSSRYRVRSFRRRGSGPSRIAETPQRLLSVARDPFTRCRYANLSDGEGRSRRVCIEYMVLNLFGPRPGA